jgi:hypothetical protein
MKGHPCSQQIMASWYLRYSLFCVLVLFTASRLVAQGISTAPISDPLAEFPVTSYAGSHSCGLAHTVDISPAVITNDPFLCSFINAMDTVELQDAGPNHLPNAPTPQNPSDTQQASQTKRILGIIPNFRAVSTDQILPAQSVKEKFITASEDSFDYSAIFIPAALAGYSMETSATPEFGTGAVGYGRYFWHAAVDQTSENYMVEFVVPAIAHQDTRYYTLGHGGILKRTGYALSRAVITRSDSANEVFNFSEVIGAGASAGLSSLYYPSRERSFTNTGTEWGVDIGIDAAAFVAKEFWPEINHRLFHGAQSRSGSQP